MKVMVPMTKELSDEINELVKDHGEALGALYDEGMAYGEVKGMVTGALLVGGAVALIGVGVLISKLTTKILEKIDEKKEERES